MARLGVSIAPLIILLDDVWRPLPQVVYCTMAIVAGLGASRLPETNNTRMPEFIEDVEEPRSAFTRICTSGFVCYNDKWSRLFLLLCLFTDPQKLSNSKMSIQL